MKERSVAPLVLLLLRKFSTSDTLASWMLVAIPQVIGLILSPIISYKSDRHRGRWGRRIPFLLIPTPIAALAMIGLAFSPFIGARLHTALPGSILNLNQSILIFFGSFWIIFEVATIAANSVFGALVNDVVPQSVLGRFYGMFRALSLIAGMIFNWWLLGKAPDHYVPIFLGVGALYALGFSLMCLKVKEGKYPPPPIDSQGPPSRIEAVKTYCRDCFTKPYYFWIFAALIIPGLAFLPINTFNLYFSQSVGMSTDRYGKLMAFYFFLSLLQAIPLGYLVDKYHPLRVAMVAIILHGAASLWGGIFIHNQTTFAIAYVATGTLSGTWFTATAALGMVLLPKMKFAQYASAIGVVGSITNTLFGLLMGPFLDFSHHHYIYTYQAGFVLDALGLIATYIVFRKFLALGGTKHYVAPE
jgi:MFS family permease